MIKKTKLLIGLSLCIVLCSCGRENENPVDTNSEQKNEKVDDIPSDMPNAYGEILDRTYEFIVDPNSRYDGNGEGKTGLAEVVASESRFESLKNLGYSCLDIDGNGIEELIIAEKGMEYGDRILAVYTLKDDQAILLLEGFIRSRYYYLGENSLYYEGSGGAAYSIFAIYEIGDDGVSIVADDYYFSDFKDMNDTDSWGWFHNTTGSMNIDDSEEITIDYETIEEEYLSKTRSLDLILFSDYRPKHNFL